MFPLVLGVGFHEVFGIVVLVVSVLSWLINVVQGNTPDGARRPQPPKPKPRTGRSEIEELLQELTADKGKPRPEQRSEPPKLPKPPAERARPKAKTTPQRPGGPPPYTPSRQTIPASEPKRTSSGMAVSDLGGGVRSQHMSNRVDTAVQQDINASVQHDLGNRIAPASMTQARPVHPLVKILRDPNGVRQAIMLNEILQRPKSLRR